MLRITTQEKEMPTLKLEGKISGPWVQVLEVCWGQARERSPSLVRVDLTDVTFVDDTGKALLTRMAARGTELVARGPLIPMLEKMNNMQVMKSQSRQSSSLGEENHR
jgi:ABC-type transporter Mla MlaB component